MIIYSHKRIKVLGNYAITIQLLNNFNDLNIKKILTLGINKGFVYYKNYLLEPNAKRLEEIKLEKIIEKFSKQDSDHPSSIIVSYNNTFFLLIINKNIENKLRIFINPIEQIWEESYNIDGEQILHIDLVKYINISLMLCFNLPIESLKAEIFD